MFSDQFGEPCGLKLGILTQKFFYSTIDGKGDREKYFPFTTEVSPEILLL